MPVLQRLPSVTRHDNKGVLEDILFLIYISAFSLLVLHIPKHKASDLKNV